MEVTLIIALVFWIAIGTTVYVDPSRGYTGDWSWKQRIFAVFLAGPLVWVILGPVHGLILVGQWVFCKIWKMLG